MPQAIETILHGTCVALGEAAVLLRGAPGSGKSDLALRFLSSFGGEGARLVADDQVRIRRAGEGLLASPPERLAGLIEVRGIGIVEMTYQVEARLDLLADLVAGDAVERLPREPLPREELLGVALPVVAIEPFAASAPVKLKLVLGGRI